MVASPSPPPKSEWTDWLFFGATAPSSASPPARLEPPESDDLDFLDDVAPAAPHWPPLTRQEAHQGREAQARQWLIPESAQAIAASANVWWHDPRLPGIDADAAQVVLTALAQYADRQAQAHGPISLLIQRVLQGSDVQLACLASRAAVQLRLSEVQEALAQQLAHNSEQLGPAGRGEMLGALEELGDGRCVRAMEAFLAQWSSRLQDHEAWRARHIVQVIRRGGRR